MRDYPRRDAATFSAENNHNPRILEDCVTCQGRGNACCDTSGMAVSDTCHTCDGCGISGNLVDCFELEHDPDRPDLEYQYKDPTLTHRALKLNGGLSWLPRRDTQLSVTGGLSSAVGDWYAKGLQRNFGAYGLTTFLRGDVKVKGLKMRAFWNWYKFETGPTWLMPGQHTGFYSETPTERSKPAGRQSNSAIQRASMIVS